MEFVVQDLDISNGRIDSASFNIVDPETFKKYWFILTLLDSRVNIRFAIQKMCLPSVLYVDISNC